MDSSVGKKVHDYLFSLGMRSRAPLQKVGGAVLDKMKDAERYKLEVAKTVSDIPAIAKEQAFTAGPRLLDTVNDYLYKPITRNARSLVTGKDVNGGNFIDRISDRARLHKKDFYATHDFNQKANREHGQLLGDVLESAVTIPTASVKGAVTVGKLLPKAPAIVKGATVPVQKTVTTLTDRARVLIPKMLSRDKKIIAKQKEISDFRAALKKGTKDLDDKQLQRGNDHIAKLKEELVRLRKDRGVTMWLEMRRKANIDKSLQQVVDPDSKLKSLAKGTFKYGALISGLGVGGAVLHNQLTKDDEVKEDNTDIESKYVSPNVFTDEAAADGKQNDQFDTGKEEKIDVNGEVSGETKDNKITNAKVDKGELPESERETTKREIPSTTQVASVYNSSGKKFPVYLIDGKLQVKKQDGTYSVIATGVTQDNLRHKFTMVANSPFID